MTTSAQRGATGRQRATAIARRIAAVRPSAMIASTSMPRPGPLNHFFASIALDTRDLKLVKRELLPVRSSSILSRKLESGFGPSDRT